MTGEEMREQLLQIIQCAVEQKDAILLQRMLVAADDLSSAREMQGRYLQAQEMAKQTAKQRAEREEQDIMCRHMLDRLKNTPEKKLSELDRFILRFYVLSAQEDYQQRKKADKKENRELNKRRKAWNAEFEAKMEQQKAEARKAARAKAAETERRKLAVPAAGKAAAQKLVEDLEAGRTMSKNAPFSFFLKRVVAAKMNQKERDEVLKHLGGLGEQINAALSQLKQSEGSGE